MIMHRQNPKDVQMCVKVDILNKVQVLEICETGLNFYARVLKGRSINPEIPECLTRLGLLRRTPDNRLVAIPPGLAASGLVRPMEAVIDRQQHALDAVHASIYRAEQVYRDSYRDDGVQAARVISGADIISTTLASAVESCREELLTAQPGGGRPQELLAKALASDLPALRRGVRQRTIYQHTVRTHSPTLSYVDQISAAGAEVRTLDEVFDRIIVCDQRIAFVPDPGEQRSQTALAVEHPGLIRYLVAMFEHAWERATPLRYSPGAHRPPLLADETRRSVLQLMVNGYTDEAIAGRLGMSVRTVATHVRKASEIFNSRSRAQLAYLIAKAGVLDEGVGN
ncbi:LuxR C-terminal-related transcriptional regulator [Streptomyces sp. NPDC056296]|uniref:LuxR C-terminal-related transcriptional regulator n=1 Tax=Streptomyces sp. NPDC056296 TaxID=3345775 RepID=UPI0035E0B51C